MGSISVSEAWRRIHSFGHGFFSVEFRRKHDKIDKVTKAVVAKAGDVRKMLCRRKVKRYVKKRGGLPPGQRKAEDHACDVCTVWDVIAFREARRAGMGLKKAGQKAYRRINLQEIVSLPVKADRNG